MRHVVGVVVVVDHSLLADPDHPGDITDLLHQLLSNCHQFSIEKPDEDLQHVNRDSRKHDGNGGVACPKGCVVIKFIII